MTPGGQFMHYTSFFHPIEESIHWTTIDPNEDMLTCFNKQVKALQAKHEFGGVIKVSTVD